MKKYLKNLFLALPAIALLFQPAPAVATTSTINPSIPAANSPLASAPVRGNFAAAYNDVNSLWAALNTKVYVGGSNGQLQYNCSGLFCGLSVVGISQGGTNATTAAAAFNNLSPMTTSGDVIYGGASGAGTRLAANATATNKFLLSTSSAVPVWQQVAFSDISGQATNAQLAGLIPSSNTITLGASGATYTTLGAALNVLNTKIIAPNILQTVTANPENFTESGITWQQPQGEQITIGGVSYSLGTPSVVSIGNAGAGNHSVVLQVSSVTNVAVNDYYKGRGFTGTHDVATLNGMWKVTAVNSGSNQFTILVTDQRATINTSTTIGGASESRVVKTKLSFAGGTALHVLSNIGNYNNNVFQNTVLVGDGVTSSAFGANIEGGANVYFSSTGFGIVNFGSHGVLNEITSTAQVDAIALSSNVRNPLYIQNGGSVSAVRTIVTGNGGDVAVEGGYLNGGLMVICGNGGSHAVDVGLGGYAILSNSIINFNTSRAVFVDQGFANLDGATIDSNGGDAVTVKNGAVEMTGGEITGNAGYGILVDKKGVLILPGTTVINSNTSHDVMVKGGSYADLGTANLTGAFVDIGTDGNNFINASAVTGSPTYSVTPNVIQPDGSLIYTGGSITNGQVLTNATGLPLSTGVTGNLPNANLAVQTANTLLGALTATTPSGQSVPSCSAAGNALLWTSGTGFSCATGYITGNQTITLSGDTTGSGTTAITTTTGKVNGVSYGASPSTNTVPVVTGSNTITYETVPNAALANSSTTVNGTTCTLGSTCTAPAAAGTLTGATLASGVTASSLTSFGAGIALGTPASGIMTNVTGTASGLTAGNVTTNANLTGPVTSTGNATAIANGAISNAMLANGAVANLSGTNTGDQTITLTGDVTGSGTGSFAATVAKIAGVAVGTPTGTGNVAFSASPTLSGTPVLGTPSATAMGIGTTSLTGYNLRINSNVTGATTAYSIRTTPTFQSDVTAAGYGLYINLSTQATSFTLADAYGVRLESGSFGAGSSVTRTSGFSCRSNITGAASTYCFRGELNSASNVYNYYGDGTADSISNGAWRFGSTTAPTKTVDVTGTLGVSSAVTMPGLASSSAAQTGTLCWTTGTGNLTVDTTTTCLLSAARFKHDIKDSPYGLASVLEMRPRTFLYNNPGDDVNLKREQVGFVAEEMEKAVPDLVSYEPDGKTLKSVAYQNVTAVLVKAVQEQQKEIDELKKLVSNDNHANDNGRRCWGVFWCRN